MHNLQFKNSAYHDLKNIDHIYQDRILKEIDGLQSNPLPPGVKKLTSTERLFRIRVGDYRVIYKIDGGTIIIYYIRHRKDAYRF